VASADNSAIEQILGYRPEELAGLSLRSFVHDEDLPKAEQILSTSLAQKRGWAAFIVRCRHKDDTYRYLECHGVPMLDATGEVVGFRTERKQADEDVRDAQAAAGGTAGPRDALHVWIQRERRRSPGACGPAEPLSSENRTLAKFVKR
jgi:PAS domain S-box-containing protein